MSEERVDNHTKGLPTAAEAVFKCIRVHTGEYKGVMNLFGLILDMDSAAELQRAVRGF